jgi:hypothetical protein
MRKIFMVAVMLMALKTTAQTFETQYERSVSDVMTDIQNRFEVRFKYNVDTVGKRLPYADFRIRPYSIERYVPKSQHRQYEQTAIPQAAAPAPQPQAAAPASSIVTSQDGTDGLPF